MNKLAVIIINHNHGELFKKCVKSLFELSDEIPFKLFVINNTPSDKMEEWLTDNFPLAEMINNPTTQGFAANANKAILYAGSVDYLLLLNPDVICLPGLIKNQIDYMETHQDIGILAPKLLNLDNTTQPNARRFPTFNALVIRALRFDKFFKESNFLRNYLLSENVFTQPGEVDWVTGAVQMIRKTALNQVGLFDERFFLYVEDVDLCCRMWRGGWKVCYFPGSEAYHNHLAESRHRLFNKAKVYHVLGHIKMFIKYKFNISR